MADSNYCIFKQLKGDSALLYPNSRLSRLRRWEDKSLEPENLAAHLPFRVMMRMFWKGEVGMRGWTRLAVLLAMAMPVSAQMPKGRYLSGMDHVCKAVLADGTPYEAWDRVYLTTWEEKPLYVKVRAYYHPGAGEFLWLSTGLSEHGYSEERKYQSKTAASCEEIHFHILILQDGEWAGFWGSNGRINVFHCGLKFPERPKAWSHVAAHWQDGSGDLRPSAKWVEEILLYKQLGHNFFRPKRLEFDARPYFYNPLVSAKKVGGQWKLEIRGADEPNRATVLLDSNFKLLEVTKNPAAQSRAPTRTSQMDSTLINARSLSEVFRQTRLDQDDGLIPRSTSYRTEWREFPARPTL